VAEHSSHRRPRAGIDALKRLPCPLCGEPLEPARGRHGLVWLCHGCHAGAVALPVLQRVAARGFVTNIWQAALHGGGKRSRHLCPSCALPFTTLAGSGMRVDVCIRCFWVWLGPRALVSLGGGRPALPAPAEPPSGWSRRRIGKDQVLMLDAPRALGALAAEVIGDAK